MLRTKYGLRTPLNTLDESENKITWLGYDPDRKRSVFIKSIPRKCIEFMEPAEKLKSVRHPLLVPVLDTFEDARFRHVVTEHLEERCTLARFLDACKMPLPEKEVVRIFGQLVEGLNVLYSCGMLHRNLRPCNVFVEQTKEGANIRLSDFGVVLKRSKKTSLSSDPCYASETVNKGIYDIKSEIHVLGYMMYLMIEGPVPAYYSKTDIPSFISSPLAWHFLNGCLQWNPEARFCWAEVYDHPLFRGEDYCIELNQFSVKGNFISKQKRLLSWIMTVGEWRDRTKAFRGAGKSHVQSSASHSSRGVEIGTAERRFLQTDAKTSPWTAFRGRENLHRLRVFHARIRTRRSHDRKPCGIGISQQEDGTVYEGMWKDGKPHGVGRMLTRSGLYFEGYRQPGRARG